MTAQIFLTILSSFFNSRCVKSNQVIIIVLLRFVGFVCAIFLLCPFLVVAKNGTVKGIITDKQTREGLIGASVILTPRESARTSEYIYAFQDMRVTLPVLSGDDSRPQRTGAIAMKDGNFEIKNVRPGEYVLTIRSLGYKTLSKTVVIYVMTKCLMWEPLHLSRIFRVRMLLL